MAETHPDAVTAAIAQRIEDIRSRIEQAAAEAGRDPASITLIGVSKVQPDDRIEAALSAGLRVYGENRVQEAQDRWTKRRAIHPDLSLHLVGALQTNKARDAVALFDAIHSLDRPKLARSLAREMAAQEKRVECFIQINTGEEPQKAGVLPADLPDLIALCRDELSLPVVGLMCLPPVEDPPALHFALLQKLAAEHALGQLSMGMSDDFEDAIRFGATHVRVGSALFGARETKT